MSIVRIMPHKKKVAKKSQRLACDACGTIISKKMISIAKTFDGSTYHFDSDNCLLIFKKLRSVYGKNFFGKASA
jgi:YHS domain-containing protein